MGNVSWNSAPTSSPLLDGCEKSRRRKAAITQTGCQAGGPGWQKPLPNRFAGHRLRGRVATLVCATEYVDEARNFPGAYLLPLRAARPS